MVLKSRLLLRWFQKAPPQQDPLGQRIRFLLANPCLVASKKMVVKSLSFLHLLAATNCAGATSLVPKSQIAEFQRLLIICSFHRLSLLENTYLGSDGTVSRHLKFGLLAVILKWLRNQFWFEHLLKFWRSPQVILLGVQ